MKTEIPYGQSSMKIELNESMRVDTFSPERTPPDEDSIARSLSHSVGFSNIASFLSGKRKILVVINDHTRPTPTPAVLRSLDLKEKEVTTIVASGAHRGPSQREIEGLLGGSHPPYGGRVIVHKSQDVSQLRPMKSTSRGTQLLLNKELFDADGIIAIGSVEPHYFAGFTGGRKFLLPGLAAYRSIEMNHSLALDERSMVLRLEGNPVHEDMMEALDIFDRSDDVFSIQLVLNRDHQVSYADSGDIVESFRGGVDHAKAVYVAPLDGKADIIITVATPPMDLDLYQSHKAIENVKLALKDQGVVILVSPCDDGIGPRGFYDLLTSHRDVSDKIGEGYRLGYHKAVKLVQLAKRAKIFAVTNLPNKTLEDISLTSFRDVQSAVDEAVRLKGKDSRILIVLDGCLTVPVPKN